MNSSRPTTETRTTDLVGFVLRPTLYGVGLVAGVAIPLTLLASDGMIPTEARPSLWTGIAVAIATTSFGNWMIARGVAGGPHGTGFVRGVVFDFALQLGTLVVGMAGMFWAAVKFPCTAAFGIAFVAAATILRITGSAVILRALDARARAGSHAPATSPDVRQDLQS